MASFDSGYGYEVTYDAVRRAMGNKPYEMQLARTDAEAVVEAVNQGIDSHLEACNCPDRGDSYGWAGGKLCCVVSAESMPVLLRRLCENDDEEGQSLARDILGTLGFNEFGVYTPLGC